MLINELFFPPADIRTTIEEGLYIDKTKLTNDALRSIVNTVSLIAMMILRTCVAIIETPFLLFEALHLIYSTIRYSIVSNEKNKIVCTLPYSFRNFCIAYQNFYNAGGYLLDLKHWYSIFVLRSE